MTAPRTSFERITELAAASPLLTLLYYLVVLAGIVVLYGRGDAPTTGFIYQAF